MEVKYSIQEISEMNDMITPKKEKKKREPHKLVIINEEELIRQVEICPILYDKSLKGYRKSALRDQCWKDIAASVNSTVEECRKRWRSLRDAFAKHYKQFDVTMSSKKKKWIFYDQMYFIAPYLDCTNSAHESAHITQLQDNSNESMLLNDDEHLENAEEIDFKPHHIQIQDAVVTTDQTTTTTGTSTTIEHVNVDNVVHQHHHHHHHQDDGNVAEATTATATATATHISTIDLNDDNQFVARIFTTATPSEYDTRTITTTTTATPSTTPTGVGTVVNCTPNSSNRKQQQQQMANTVDTITVERLNDDYATITTPTPSITDPDERFLLSCAPILKRLSNKKNALARLRIQQILFSIEFGDQ